MKKPLILISNDDGFEAKGLYALVEAAKDFGEIVVVVPDRHRSGVGHCITMDDPLRIELYCEEDGIRYYRTNGTPVDCIKLGQKVILRDRHIDLVLSGINHGSNSSVSLLYSGTMAAAIEGCFEGSKAAGFSLLDYAYDADFTTAIHCAKKLIPQILAAELPPQIALNINIPQVPLNEIKGVKITRQTKGYWAEDLEPRKDAFGRTYYWLSGYLVDQDHKEDCCQWALTHNYVSVQPVQIDMTAYHCMNNLKFMEE